MPEKNLNQMPQDVRALFTRGADALQRDNHAYAIDLFTEALTREPGFYECRKALRTAQLHKTGGGGLLKKLLSRASSSPLFAKAELALRKNPAETLHTTEQILNSDPNNSAAHRLIVRAATAMEMPRTAVLSLKVLFRNSPADKKRGIQLANALSQLGDVNKGEQILAELCHALPTDTDLAQELKNISAKKTMAEGGYDSLADGSGSYRNILKSRAEAAVLEQESRIERTEDVAQRLIGEYEARLKIEPNNLNLVKSLAELYQQQREFDAALSCYERLKASDLANDASLDRAISDTVARKLDHQISQLDPLAPDFAETSATLQAEKQACQLAACRKRVERFPTDLEMRFEIGQLYFREGKISEAISEFQRAQNNPHRRVAAMNWLAQCFAKRRMYDIAARTLQNAIKEKPVLDEEKKELIYRLGTVLEMMQKQEEAVAQFKIIYEADIGYQDVAGKLDSYYQGGIT